jgi:hypothetical protein
MSSGFVGFLVITSSLVKHATVVFFMPELKSQPTKLPSANHVFFL